MNSRIGHILANCLRSKRLCNYARRGFERHWLHAEFCLGPGLFRQELRALDHKVGHLPVFALLVLLSVCRLVGSEVSEHGKAGCGGRVCVYVENFGAVDLLKETQVGELGVVLQH